MPLGGVAFYNCGPASGRSQPHKHVQVVPLPLDERQAPVPPIASVTDVALADAAPLAAVELRQLPFRAYATRLPSG
jgi:ATP adenylyltransferase